MISTLAIETSCDDTSLSLVRFDGQEFFVDKLLAYSQIDDHQQYGWVVPEFASRLHSEKILAVLQKIGLEHIMSVDFISVTTHPGLPWSLVVGKAVAQFLSAHFDKPLVEVNHIYGHLFSLFLERNIEDIQLPMMVLTASGGHNDIYLVKSLKHEAWSMKHEEWNMKSWVENSELEWKDFGGYMIARLGKTLDDAAGECFDKVARMLGGPYPGWARIADRASRSPKVHQASKVESQEGSADFIDLTTLQPSDSIDIVFKRIFLSKDWYDFSFSWMKSQVSFLLKQLEIKNIPMTEALICDIAYEFQESVVEVLVKKLTRAAIQYWAKTIGIAWWVSCNERLWEYLNEYWPSKIKDSVFLRPIKKVYSTDNGAMIWLAGILAWNNEK